jgi:capsular polysaccharide biosynthesis protein
MEQFNLISFFKLIWKWRKPVMIVCGIGIAGSIVISDPRIMPPYFQSSSIFYPLNPNMTSSGALFSSSESYLFGGNADVDRILSIASSAPLKLYIVNKFKLFQHYKIDSASQRYPIYSVLKELDNNYSYEKNDKGAVVITVQDRDRFQAAQMVNEIVNKIDQTNRDLLNDNKKKILEIYKSKMKDKEEEVKRLTDTIFMLKQEFNLYTDIDDLPSQMKYREGSKGAAYDAASERVKVLEEKKKGAIRELNNNIVQFEQYKASINTDVPTLFILEKAFPAEKKSKPVRWLIVLGTALISFVLCALAILLIERFKGIKEAFKNA